MGGGVPLKHAGTGETARPRLRTWLPVLDFAQSTGGGNGLDDGRRWSDVWDGYQRVSCSFRLVLAGSSEDDRDLESTQILWSE